MQKKTKVHFIGITGSGISGVACIAKQNGFDVDGCDLNGDINNYTQQLLDNNIKILSPHDPEHIKDADIVVLTPALLYKDKYKQIEETRIAMETKTTIKWQKFLGDYIMKDKNVIAVAGTHGKTTTTTLISLILEKANFDPTVFVGGVVKEWGTVDPYSSDEYQKMYPIDSDRNRENEFFVSKYDKLEKISKVDAYMSLREGYTFGGLSSQEKRTIKSYTYATPQNSELRKGTKIEEIPSAMILQNVINRTKSERGTYYRGIRTEEGAKSLLNLKKGDIYVDNGFMSTDRNKDVAKNFATSKVMIEVNSKGGMGKSLSVSEFSMHPEENEVLFNAGTRMKIKDIVKDDGYTIYKVEVL